MIPQLSTIKVEYENNIKILALPSFQMCFISNFDILTCDVQNYHLESVLGFGFGVSHGVSFGGYENSTVTEAAAPVLDTRILVCQWWGETLKTDLRDAWNFWAKLPSPWKVIPPHMLSSY